MAAGTFERGSTEHELEVKNNSYSGSVRIAAELPDGWKTDSNQYDLELEAGQAEKMSFTLTTPDSGLSRIVLGLCRRY